MSKKIERILQRVQKCETLLQKIAQDLNKLKEEKGGRERKYDSNSPSNLNGYIQLYSSFCEEWKKQNYESVSVHLNKMSVKELQAFIRANQLPVNIKTSKKTLTADIQELLAQSMAISSPVFEKMQANF